MYLQDPRVLLVIIIIILLIGTISYYIADKLDKKMEKERKEKLKK